MKSVPNITAGEFATTTIIKEVCSIAPSGMTLAQMRSRIRVLDAVDAAKENSIQLEDADYATLSDAVNGMSWARADKSLLEILDSILEAKPTPKE